MVSIPTKEISTIVIKTENLPTKMKILNTAHLLSYECFLCS